MAGKLFVVGIGPGNREFIYPAAQKIIESGDVLIGGRRNLEQFSYLNKEEVVIGGKLEDVDDYIINNIKNKNLVVLATGDPGIFSISEHLKKISGIEPEVYPGISSLQYLCARVNKSWDDAYIISLHGRDSVNLAEVFKNYSKAVIFTGGNSSPDRVCRELLKIGLNNAVITVGENLSYPKERIISGSPAEIGKMQFDSLSIMLVEYEKVKIGIKHFWDYTTQGIPDEMFIRGDVPMTKQEVRAVTLAKLMLKEDSILYDIGAGTGSVSVECGLKLKKGRIYAIEKEPDAIDLIHQNIDKFGLGNVKVIEGEAPKSLDGLPVPDRIFIGGTSGSMEGILDWINRLDGNMRVVINAVAIETAYEALEGFKNRDFKDIDITCVSVSRGKPVGKKHLMQALNPVYIVSAEKD